MLRLSVERVARGWTKTELARRAQMQAGDVGKIESGRMRPYPRQLRKLGRALGIPAAEVESLIAESPAGEQSEGMVKQERVSA